jgi:DNA-binding transcriptional LysR family regulator
MSDIETRLLRYFVAVAEERHFTRAALRLGITPPTLTQQIQKLERDLGVRLLLRKGYTPVALTAAGQRFLASARETLRQVEEGAAIARQAARGEVGRIELGFGSGVSLAGLLQTWIGEFEHANPAVHIAMHRMGPIAQIAGLMRKELDAGLTRAPHEYPVGLKGIEVYRQRLVLALPREHPLARHPDIGLAMLRDETFVDTTPEPDVGFFGYTEVVAGIGNFTPRVSRRGNDFIAVLTFVSRGYGIALLPQTRKTTNFPNVVFRDIAGDPVPESSIAFVYHDDPSPATNRLIKHMRRHALPHRPDGLPRGHPRLQRCNKLNDVDGRNTGTPPRFTPRGPRPGHDRSEHMTQ